jgi:hypothetical protein
MLVVRAVAMGTNGPRAMWGKPFNVKPDPTRILRASTMYRLSSQSK